MKVIAAISQKGGAGKSTLVRHLSVIAGEAGPSYLIDRDPQATTGRWADRRSKIEPEPPQPTLLNIEGTTLTAAIAKLRNRPGTLFIDTRPEVSETVSEAARVADLVIVPVRPSMDDIEAAPATLAMLRRLERPAIIVVNAARNMSRATAAKSALSRWGVKVCPTALSDRTVYLDASQNGLGITEFPGAAGRAAEVELREVWAWIESEEVLAHG